MELVSLLKGVELFDGLDDDDLAEIAGLCHEVHYRKGEVITAQGEAGNELYIVRDGFVEVLLNAEGGQSPRAVVNLGTGQIFGEMALVDQGPRSASVRAVGDDTSVNVIDREAFTTLCERNTRVGYVVMRNMAADLSFKLRHHHLTHR